MVTSKVEGSHRLLDLTLMRLLQGHAQDLLYVDRRLSAYALLPGGGSTLLH